MRIDEYGDFTTPAGLYDFAGQITRGCAGFNGVAESDIEQFHALGFLVVHEAIDSAAIEAARAGLRAAILRGGNHISYESAAAARLETLGDEERLDSVRKLMPVIDFDARLRQAAKSAPLLDVVGRILGETPTLTQDMALLKPPLIGREKPWHQDMAYFDYPGGTTIVGVWMALDEALPENGCMMIIPASHQQGPALHWQRRDWQICDSDVPVGRSLAVPLPPGGCLLFHCLLQHGTPPSRSRKRRWALQFHYAPDSVAQLPDSAQRLSIFGAEGKDASC